MQTQDELKVVLAACFRLVSPFDVCVLQVGLILIGEAGHGDKRMHTLRLGVNEVFDGGLFDPMGMSKNEASFKEAKVKEIKNGRLVSVPRVMASLPRHHVLHSGHVSTMFPR
eukprot:scaffold558_cov16-Tisochrysis_lutea.AAC.1